MNRNTISKLLDKELIVKRYKNGETINKIRISCNVTFKVIKSIVEKSGVVFDKHPKYTKWNKEDVIREAKKYKHRSHFMKGNNSAYNAAHRMNLKESFEHMEPLGHVKSRLVYVYEFPDNHVYVGLTANKDKRHGEHMRDGRGPVYKHMNKIGVEPRYRMVSDWYIDHTEAQELEKNTVDEYRQNGWVIMNVAPAGNLGGNLYKWNENNLKEVTLKYRTRYDMIKGDPNAYSVIIQKGWKHLFNHMEWEGNISHTIVECMEEAKKYTCKEDFRRDRYDLWQWTYRHKHSDVVFAHMVNRRKTYECTIYNEREKLKFNSMRELERFFLGKNISQMSRHRFKEGKLIKGTDYYFTTRKL
jgi:hypothetical protein